ncbi:MAG: carbohydrate ABC transporter permease [Rhodobacteraceae bacterium]|nr:carbohydrate ABC transporter permease [Paracoccaceae bacterium]
MISPRTRRRLLVVLLHGMLGVWLIYSVLPPVMLIAASFNSTALFRSPLDLLLLRDFTLTNFSQAFTRGAFWFFFQNSVIISSAAVVITLVVCVPMAYGLTKISGRAKSVVSFGVLAMRFIPYVVLALPLFLVYVNLGLAGSRAGLLLAHLAIHIPFATWMLIGYFESVPPELEKAGIIDGCSPWNLFWNVTLPVVRPGIIALAILVFIMSWNEYLFALFLAGSNAQPLTVGITRFLGGAEAGVEYGIIAAYSVLIVSPVIVFALAANRLIVSGMTAGAVKG